MSYFSLVQCRTILVFGANKGLGLAFTRHVLQHTEAQIYAISRHTSAELQTLHHDRLICITLDIFDEDALASLAHSLEQVDLIINSIGFLHNDTFQPEKTLNDIQVEQMLYSFKVNTLPTGLILKHFKRKLARQSVYLVLGAKVASLEDNQLGGWYGYRCSKTALNMLIKNADIELQRFKKGIRLLCFHPGTTETSLSEPFLGHIKHKIWQADEAAANLLIQIERVYPEQSLFYFWDGTPLPW